jgi:hypothetical protein
LLNRRRKAEDKAPQILKYSSLKNKKLLEELMSTFPTLAYSKKLGCHGYQGT